MNGLELAKRMILMQRNVNPGISKRLMVPKIIQDLLSKLVCKKYMQRRTYINIRLICLSPLFFLSVVFSLMVLTPFTQMNIGEKLKLFYIFVIVEQL